MIEEPAETPVPGDEDQPIIKCSCGIWAAHKSDVCEHCRGMHKGLSLPDHALMFYEERGVDMPLIGTPEGDKAYSLWAKWAFADMNDDRQQAEAEALAAIEEWEKSMFDPWWARTLPRMRPGDEEYRD